MTREEAARIIKKCKEKGFKYTFYTLEEYYTALDMAIEALEQEPKTDTWSIKDVADTLAKHGLIVEQEPSAQPEIIRCKDCKYWRGHKYAKETKRYIPFVDLMPSIQNQMIFAVGQKGGKMTREEAIKVLEMFLLKQCDLERTEFAYDANTVWRAVKMASEALDQEPCKDCISREAVRDLMYHKQEPLDEYDLDTLPSVTPKPEIVRCNQCKYAEVADSEDSQDGYTCQFHRGSIWFSGSYCSWAERRQDG